MNKKILLAMMFLFLNFNCSVMSNKNLIKPDDQTVIKYYYPSEKLKISNNSSASLPNLSKKMKSIKIISMRYSLPVNKNAAKNLWQRELEKYFLREGISLYKEDIVDDIPLLVEKKSMKSDALLIIDNIQLYKVNDTCNISLSINLTKRYSFSYFIASIAGKLYINNKILLWSSSSTASSFKSFNNLNPHIKLTAKKRFRYSSKINKWLDDSWICNFQDNFQNQYNETHKSNFHKTKLVRYVVGQFVKSLKLVKD